MDSEGTQPYIYEYPFSPKTPLPSTLLHNVSRGQCRIKPGFELTQFPSEVLKNWDLEELGILCDFFLAKIVELNSLAVILIG